MQIVRRQRRSRGREGDLRRPLVSIIGPCRVIIYFLIAFIRYICIYISILGEIFSIFVAALSLIKYRVGFFFFYYCEHYCRSSLSGSDELYFTRKRIANEKKNNDINTLH